MKRGKLIFLAILVRLFFIILALLADNLSPDYDNSMAAESSSVVGIEIPSNEKVLKNENSENNENNNNNENYLPPNREVYQKSVFNFLDPLMRWDAVHFRYIAKFGYTHEHLCAFFPMMPKLLNFFGLATQQQQQQEKINSLNSNNNNNNFFQTKKPPIINEILFLSFHIFCFALATVFLREILLDVVAWIHGFSIMSALHQHQRATQELHSQIEPTDSWKNHPSPGEKKYHNSSSDDDEDDEQDENVEVSSTSPKQTKKKKRKDHQKQKEEKVAFSDSSLVRSSLMIWLLNPASVFFSAAYTETYFALCSFAGIYCIHRLFEVSGALSQPAQREIRLVPLSKTKNIKKATTTNSASPQVSSAVVNDINNDIEEKKDGVDDDDDDPDEKKRENKKNSSSSGDVVSVVSFSKSILYLIAATCCFVVAATFRSNGLLLAGYFLHFAFLGLWFNYNTNIKTQNNINSTNILPISQKIILVILSLVATICLLIPYQQHVTKCYTSFCVENNINSNNNNGADPFVCNKGVNGFYGGIQYKYWKNGFFEYYTVNNIPNFLIAAPTFIFCVLGFWYGIFGKRWKSFSSDTENGYLIPLLAPVSSNSNKYNSLIRRILSLLSKPESAHFVLLFVQLLIALLTMNVQVVTRFVSATPVLYFCYGCILTSTVQFSLRGPSLLSLQKNSSSSSSSSKNTSSHSSVSGISSGPAVIMPAPTWMKKLCVGFCLVWAVVGTALFPNFMPWT